MPNTAELLPASGIFDTDSFQPLLTDPSVEVEGTINGVRFGAGIAIKDYAGHITRHFSDRMLGDLSTTCAQAAVSFGLKQFGLVVTFSNPIELNVHGEDMVVDDSIRTLVDRFGPVIMRNARMTISVRDRFHRNIFPHLRFHVDRGSNMPNQYSCFTRDPSVPDQRAPRASSTLFIANIVAWLESARNSDGAERSSTGVRPSYDLFGGTKLAPLLGNIILEQPWSAAEGTGEICIIDNRTVLHATWHKDGSTAGYPIGARYLF